MMAPVFTLDHAGICLNQSTSVSPGPGASGPGMAHYISLLDIIPLYSLL